MNIYGYARVSTKKQNIERQIRNILAEYPSAKIYSEAVTGTKIELRSEWKKLYGRLSFGDVVVFDSVSRMSRNAEEGISLYFDLYEKGVELVFLKEHYIDTSTYKQELERVLPSISTDIGNEEEELINGILGNIQKYMRCLAKKQITLAFGQAEKEVTDLHVRVKEGLETARRNGKRLGQTEGRKLNVKKKKPIMDIIMKHSKSFLGTLSDAEVISLIRGNSETGTVARGTYYKYKKELLSIEQEKAKL